MSGTTDPAENGASVPPGRGPKGAGRYELDQAFLRDTGRWTAVFGGLGAMAGSAIFDWRLGLGIALGALLAHLNLMMVARALGDALGRIVEVSAAEMAEAPAAGAAELPEAPDLEAPVGRERARFRASGLLRLPLVVLALVLILWYMPARPEGVAFGVLLSLLAAVFAALRANRRPPPHGASPPT